MQEQNLSRLILNLSHTIIKNRNRHLQELGLTASQADCVKYFIEHRGASIKDLRGKLGITHQTAQGLVARLIEKGFLSAEQSQNDRRYQIITATEKGIALSGQLAANGERTARLLTQGMAPREQKLFFHLLQTAYENVKNDGRIEYNENTDD